MILTTKKKMTSEKWNSLNIRVKTAEGWAYVIIDESKPGKIERIHMHIGKAGSSINAMCAALADSTLLISKTKGLAEAIVNLSGHTSDRIADHHGMEIKSVPEALMYALMQYRASIPEDPDIKRGPRFRRY